MTSTQRRLQPPKLGEVMRDLTKNGDLATAARLKTASGISVIDEPEKRKKDNKKHPYAYLYINDSSLSEATQGKRLQSIASAFLSGKDEKIANVFRKFESITVNLPKGLVVVALKIDASLFNKCRLSRYLESRANTHKLAVYTRKPRQDVQGKVSIVSTHEPLRG